MSDVVEPKETVTLKSSAAETSAFEASTLPVSNERSEPPPRACFICSAYPGSVGSPG